MTKELLDRVEKLEKDVLHWKKSCNKLSEQILSGREIMYKKFDKVDEKLKEALK